MIEASIVWFPGSNEPRGICPPEPTDDASAMGSLLADRLGGPCPTDSAGACTGNLRSVWEQFYEALPEGARVLDIGTGNGALPLIALDTARCRSVTLEVHGVDLARIDPRRDVPDGVRLFEGAVFHGGVSAEAMPFAAGCFARRSWPVRARIHAARSGPARGTPRNGRWRAGSICPAPRVVDRRAQCAGVLAARARIRGSRRRVRRSARVRRRRAQRCRAGGAAVCPHDRADAASTSPRGSVEGSTCWRAYCCPRWEICSSAGIDCRLRTSRRQSMPPTEHSRRRSSACANWSMPRLTKRRCAASPIRHAAAGFGTCNFRRCGRTQKT